MSPALGGLCQNAAPWHGLAEPVGLAEQRLLHPDTRRLPLSLLLPPPLLSAHLPVDIKASSQLQESLVTTQERATQSAVAGCHCGCPAPLPHAEGSPAALPP